MTTPSNQINSVVYLLSQGLLKISGPDSKKLLQGQLTCDLEKITPTQSSLGALCNPKGRVISLFRIFIFKSDYYLQMSKNVISITIAALKKYAVFYKVSMEDVSNEIQIIGYTGELPDNLNDNDNLVIIPTSASRYEIIATKAIIKAMYDKLLHQSQVSTENDWKCLDIESNIPAIYPETSETFLPHDLNLHLLNAVDFKKGCYTGQEIVARMHYLGKLKNHLRPVRMKLDTAPLYGAEITIDSGNKGHIVDYCKIDYNTYQILVVSPESTRKE